MNIICALVVQPVFHALEGIHQQKLEFLSCIVFREIAEAYRIPAYFIMPYLLKAVFFKIKIEQLKEIDLYLAGFQTNYPVFTEGLGAYLFGDGSRTGWWYYFFEDDRRTGLAALP